MDPPADHGERSYRGTGKLTGRTALVTGGDSGIGRAVALAFAREGADVAISYLDEEQDAQATARLVEEAGRRCLTIGGDIRAAEHCKAVVDRVMETFGRLDILVNNAAFQMVRQKIDEIPSEEFDRTFRTNIYATFHFSKAAMAVMRPGGAIINTASIEAYSPSPTLLAYSASKGAIVTFTKGLAYEAIQQGIRVNAVAPGPVWTPLIPYSFPQEQVRTFGQEAPIKRPAQPAELAPVYVFLASDEASYVAGGVYGVTGGMMMA